jgi:hypothetical protein
MNPYLQCRGDLMGHFYFMERDFKGVWIPKEIWLDENLTWMEKLLLVEIDSLDKEKGCFASNAYFGKFFQLSGSRISEIIKGLVEKGYITSFLLYDGKQVKQRILTPTLPIRKTEWGIRNTEEGYSEKAKDNNTVINNTINNTNKSINISFSEFWDLYDKKVGDKTKLEKKWNNLTDDERQKAMHHSVLYKHSQLDKKYRKNPETYLNNKSFNDEIITDTKIEFIYPSQKIPKINLK